MAGPWASCLPACRMQNPSKEDRIAALWNAMCVHAYFGDAEVAQIPLRGGEPGVGRAGRCSMHACRLHLAASMGHCSVEVQCTFGFSGVRAHMFEGHGSGCPGAEPLQPRHERRA